MTLVLFLQDNEYEDAGPLYHADDLDISNSATIPYRPTPTVPKGDLSQQEDIFVALSDIQRCNSGEKSHTNFEGFDHELLAHEKNLFDTSTDTSSERSDSDRDDVLMRKNIGDVKTNEVGVNLVSDCENEDKLCKLPNASSAPHESDTSEDSDFIAASFWLRNRKADLNPSAVPFRFDSQLGKPPTQNRVSMHSDDLICKVAERSSMMGSRSESPTLAILDQAPELPQSPTDSSNIYDYPKPSADKVQISAGEKHLKSKASCFTHSQQPLPESYDDREHDKDYERLIESKCKSFTNTEEDKHTDSIYEVTWQCPETIPDGNLFEPRKLVVNLPEQDRESTVVKSTKCLKDVEDDCVRPKHLKNVFSRVFSKKRKSKELPESLTVAVPRTSESCGSGENKNEGNIYSDFPSPSHEKALPTIDSDILKESIASGPKLAIPDPAIELPKRNFGEMMSNSQPNQHLSQSACVTHLPEERLYEDMTRPVIVNSQSLDLPPSPPPKHGAKDFPILSKTFDDKPVAPPRRNKKEGSSGSLPQAFDSTAYGIETFSSNISSWEGSKLPMPVSDREPVLPPRRKPMKEDSSNSPPLPAPRRTAASGASFSGMPNFN